MHLLLKWVPQKMHRWQVDDAQAPDTLVTFVWLWIGQIQNTKKKKKKFVQNWHLVKHTH